MIDALRTIMEGILKLATHGNVLILAVGAMLAIILVTAWFDGRDNADRARKRRRTRREQARDCTGDRGTNWNGDSAGPH